MTDQELLEQLRRRITARPDLVPQVLNMVQSGMKAWETSVEQRMHHRMDAAIASALSLPTRGNWSIGNRNHRTFLRIVAVGWGLAHRTAGSVLEKAVATFVHRADVREGKEAVAHYATLQSEPVPQTLDDVLEEMLERART